MKTIYSLLATICLLSNAQAIYANHEKGSEKNFHFGPVPNAAGGEGEREGHNAEEEHKF